MTAAIPQKNIYANAVSQTGVLDTKQNPRAIRWGYGAGLLKMSASPRETGMPTGVVPQGEFVAFLGANIPIDNPNLDDAARTINYELTPFEAIEAVKMDWASVDEPKGFKELVSLTGVTDEPTISAIEYIVNPSFAELGHSCPEGLNVCPSCRLELLNRVPQRIEELADELLVNKELCYQVLAEVTEANNELFTFYRNNWENIKGELETSAKGGHGVKKLTPDHLYIRACLHESAPEEKQAQIVTAYGAQLGEALSKSQESTAILFAEALKSLKSEDKSDDKITAILAQMQEDNRQRDQLITNLFQTQRVETDKGTKK